MLRKAVRAQQHKTIPGARQPAQSRMNVIHVIAFRPGQILITQSGDPDKMLIIVIRDRNLPMVDTRLDQEPIQLIKIVLPQGVVETVGTGELHLCGVVSFLFRQQVQKLLWLGINRSLGIYLPHREQQKNKSHYIKQMPSQYR